MSTARTMIVISLTVVLSACAAQEADPARVDDDALVNAEPSAPEVRILPEGATVDDEVTCTILRPSIDPENAPLEYDYRWSRWDWHGERYVVASFSDPVLPPAATRAGDRWLCEVRAFDGYVWGPLGSDELEVQRREE